MLLSLDSPEHSFGHILKIEHLLGHHVLSHFHFEMILSAVVTYLAGMLGTSTHWHVDSWNLRVGSDPSSLLVCSMAKRILRLRDAVSAVLNSPRPGDQSLSRFQSETPEAEVHLGMLHESIMGRLETQPHSGRLHQSRRPSAWRKWSRKIRSNKLSRYHTIILICTKLYLSPPHFKFKCNVVIQCLQLKATTPTEAVWTVACSVRLIGSHVN